MKTFFQWKNYYINQYLKDVSYKRNIERDIRNLNNYLCISEKDSTKLLKIILRIKGAEQALRTINKNKKVINEKFNR